MPININNRVHLYISERSRANAFWNFPSQIISRVHHFTFPPAHMRETVSLYFASIWCVTFEFYFSCPNRYVVWHLSNFLFLMANNVEHLLWVFFFFLPSEYPLQLNIYSCLFSILFGWFGVFCCWVLRDRTALIHHLQP